MKVLLFRNHIWNSQRLWLSQKKKFQNEKKNRRERQTETMDALTRHYFHQVITWSHDQAMSRSSLGVDLLWWQRQRDVHDSIRPDKEKGINIWGTSLCVWAKYFCCLDRLLSFDIVHSSLNVCLSYKQKKQTSEIHLHEYVQIEKNRTSRKIDCDNCWEQITVQCNLRRPQCDHSHVNWFLDIFLLDFLSKIRTILLQSQYNFRLFVHRSTLLEICLFVALDFFAQEVSCSHRLNRHLSCDKNTKEVYQQQFNTWF